MTQQKMMKSDDAGGLFVDDLVAFETRCPLVVASGLSITESIYKTRALERQKMHDTKITPHADGDAEQPSLATVLLVDDDANLLRGLTRNLDGEFRLLTAVSPVEAEAIIAQESVDLILSDNLMAGSLGTEFLAKVRSKYPRIKLLMLSGYMPPAAAQRVIRESGVLQVLTKPCGASEVADAIRNALAETFT